MKKLNKKERLANTVEGYASCFCNCGCGCSCTCHLILFDKSNNTDNTWEQTGNTTWETTGATMLG